MKQDRKVRNAAFESGDIGWAKSLLPNRSSDYVAEMAFHKARMDCSDISMSKREESQVWLWTRGLTDGHGQPIDPTRGLET